MSVLYTKLKEEEEFSFHRHFTFSFSVSSIPEENPEQPEGRADSPALWLFFFFLTVLPGLQDLSFPAIG